LDQCFHLDNIEQSDSVSNAATRRSLHDHIGMQGHLPSCLHHNSHPLRRKLDHVGEKYAVTLPIFQLDKDNDPSRITVSTVDLRRQGYWTTCPE